MGSLPWRHTESGDDVPGHPAPRLDAQKKTLVATEQDAAEREQWRDAISDEDPAQFVFIDEASTTVALTPRYARAPQSERAHGSAPRNYGYPTTLVAGLTPNGITAPMTLPGAMNSAAFLAYVTQILVPVLSPGQIVICDNLSVHKRADIRTAIEQAGCAFIFLPAYSPDFNPIEQAFSKLKAFLRRAEARTQEALDAAITEALATVTVADARGWFAHAGYDLSGQVL